MISGIYSRNVLLDRNIIAARYEAKNTIYTASENSTGQINQSFMIIIRMNHQITLTKILKIIQKVTI